MKRFIITLILMHAAASMYANIADPNPGSIVQPDGTTIAAVLHGDEYGHTLTTPDGVTLRRDATGFYRPGAAIVPTGIGGRVQKTRTRDLSRRAPSQPGEYHFLVILIQFSDLHFTIPSPRDAFDAMLNEKGYSANGGTGSAADYYRDNSGGLFSPVFDVAGPVTLQRPYSYYGANKYDGSDSHADQALFEACQQIDADVDFSRYDSDADGSVDGVFFYYAGHNEAEYGGEDTIWPHQWCLYNYRQAIFDGVRVFSYACTSEYRGSTGSSMCGIGTFCHEFGHVLGLPDLYDTDGTENGSAESLYEFSLMSEGSYNNSGRTPANLTFVERNMLGWVKMPLGTDKSGAYDLDPGDAMLLDTTNEGEYFICEVRDGRGWDAQVPSGLLVYHVDMSGNKVGKSTAKDIWDYGYGINCHKDHPCLYIVKAKNSNMTKYFPFPGAAGITTFSHDTWSGYALPFSMDGIAFDGSRATFNLLADQSRTIAGTVSGKGGNALGGATVTAMAQTPGSAVSVKTDESGKYSLDVTAIGGGVLDISARLAGYSPVTASTPAKLGTTVMDFGLEQKVGTGSLDGMGFTYILEYGKLIVGEGKAVDSVTWGRRGNAVTAAVVYKDGSSEQLTMDP